LRAFVAAAAQYNTGAQCCLWKHSIDIKIK